MPLRNKQRTSFDTHAASLISCRRLLDEFERLLPLHGALHALLFQQLASDAMPRSTKLDPWQLPQPVPPDTWGPHPSTPITSGVTLPSAELSSSSQPSNNTGRRTLRMCLLVQFPSHHYAQVHGQWVTSLYLFAVRSGRIPCNRPP